ncbi:phosphohistidine phosphatase SixA [Pelagicoccus albus]|uniref:Phosphohistidine phosphatase SixA n=1 Tax=Pelagicoccus albus TaxID=415222 RepID=A0A7X1B9Q2_9BACT|nr:phosphohistidine phosphatase SixA [Pelagicoccus albus]MBC2606988.1 phosphohistidine phosphatase SixA [Pelagicoccus albus]
MQQTIYIARHAHALDEAPSDALRPLSEKGHKQCARLVQGLRKTSLLSVSEVWHSGYLRAEQTASALANGLGLPLPHLQKDGLTPYDHPRSIAEKINQTHENFLLAGHEPNLSHLASLLLSGRDDFQAVIFPKASILCLSRMKVGSQATPWQIEWHLNHKHYK